MPDHLTRRKYHWAPTFVRLFRTVEEITLGWMGIDPLIVRSIALNVQLRFTTLN